MFTMILYGVEKLINLIYREDNIESSGLNERKLNISGI